MNSPKKPAGRPPGSGMAPGSSQQAQEMLTRRLREYYDSIEDEGIPDRFLDLLEKLDDAEKKAREAGPK